MNSGSCLLFPFTTRLITGTQLIVLSFTDVIFCDNNGVNIGQSKFNTQADSVVKFFDHN
ncbi:Uncharacterised protein [Citrobacter youngae]|nr:Uncharacterised protein [Citrobacter youngae]